MLSSSETKIDPASIGNGAPAVRRRGQDVRRDKAVAIVWPSTSSERKRVFERWEGSAMECLRAANSDLAVIISFRKVLRLDGRITATNTELAVAAGCGIKTLEIDLRRLKAAGLISSTFQSMRGFRGRRRVLRLSLPS